MSGLYHGHLAEYPRIRVDHFSTVKDDSIPIPRAFVRDGETRPQFFPRASLYLLSHCHTDHTQGLDSVTGGLHIICSQETKDIILNLETAADRRSRDNGDLKRAVKPYGRLRTKEGIDLLDARPYYTPIRLQLTASPPQLITLTLLPANHCPGATMFLIEGDNGPVLHTGDVRCEGSFVKQMMAPGGGLERFEGWWEGEGKSRERLSAVYVDSSMMLGTGDMMEKKDAVQGMMDLIAMYPAETRFYVNAWTWGYEELLIAICEAYPDHRIHLDRYKRSIYKLLPSVTEPLVRFTGDPSSARFHACDLGNRCESVGFTSTDDGGWKPKTGGLVVNLNPAELRVAHWDVYRADLERKFAAAWEGRGDWPASLVIPFARHSPLPELRHLLYSLRPKTVYPNTLLSKTHHPIEYLALPYIFPALSPSTLDRLRSDIASWCAVNFRGGEAEAWAGVEDWIRKSQKGAGKEGVGGGGGAKEENWAGGGEAMKVVEKGLVMTGLVGVGEEGTMQGWAGKEVGGRGKLARVVGTVLRMCNAGNGDAEVERDEDPVEPSRYDTDDDQAELAAALALSVQQRPTVEPANAVTSTPDTTIPTSSSGTQRSSSRALVRLRSLTPEPDRSGATTSESQEQRMLSWAEQDGSRFVSDSSGADVSLARSTATATHARRSSGTPVSSGKRLASSLSASGSPKIDLDDKAGAKRLRHAFSNSPIAKLLRDRRKERESLALSAGEQDEQSPDL